MPRSLALYLEDILAASDYILRRTSGMTREAYIANDDIRFAVERNFIIIGEAIAQMRDYHPSAFAQINERSKIMAFRNVLAHAYFSIDDEDVWSVVRVKLPELREQVQEWLNNGLVSTTT